MSDSSTPSAPRYLTVHVRQSWTRLWWIACNANEVLAIIDSPTYSRSRSRQGAIDKCVKRWQPKEWGENVVVEL